MALGSNGMGLYIATTDAGNQLDSESSHSFLIVFGRSLNQRVAGASPARFTKIHSKMTFIAVLWVWRQLGFTLILPQSLTIELAKSPSTSTSRLQNPHRAR